MNFPRLAAVAALIALAACSGSDSSIENTANPCDETIILRIVQVDDLVPFCGAGAGACYSDQSGRRTIYIPPVTSPWTQYDLQQRLGHEVLHALGYHHD